jgi:hypothetical protein
MVMEATKQKFHKGDLVHVAKDLGPYMEHFTNDIDAIVLGSYNDQFGGGDIKSYSLHLKGKGHSSWYYESQLTLLENNRPDLLNQWEAEAEAEIKIKSDLDWIFSHGQEVLDQGWEASVQALANCFGLINLWGNHGEGFIYFENATITLALAEPYLKTNDKIGWLSLCKGIKQKSKNQS